MNRFFACSLMFALFCGLFASPVHAEETNLAQGKTATSSGNESDDLAPSNAVDGKADTRWSSAFNDDQWLQIDLGQPTKIASIAILWEAAFGTEYKLQVSDDAKQWKDVASVTDGKGGEETRSFDAVTTRYVRMLGIKRSTEYGYSIWEFRVFAAK